MTQRPPKIMLFEREPGMVELLVAALTRRFNAHLTCVADAAMCLDTELIEPHDLAILDAGRDHDGGLDLAANLLSLGARPVVMLMDEPRVGAVIEAMRVGACVVFEKPFPITELLNIVAQALRTRAIERARSVKYARMREMVRRVIRERRELNGRMELVCRDLVGAQRRLVNRVLSLEEQMVNGSSA